MDFEDFQRLGERLVTSNVAFGEALDDTNKELNDDEEEKMSSYLGKYILEVKIHLSRKRPFNSHGTSWQ